MQWKEEMDQSMDGEKEYQSRVYTLRSQEGRKYMYECMMYMYVWNGINEKQMEKLIAANWVSVCVV